MKKIYINLLCAAMICTTSFAQNAADFEDLGLAAESYWNGSDGSGWFTSGDYTFYNNFTDWGEYGTSWDGFAYSTMTSTTYASLDDQYNCVVGHGANGSQTFAVVYCNAYEKLPTVKRVDGEPFKVYGFSVTNSAYAYTSMKEGDAYAKKFDSDDWFLLTITGYYLKDKVGTVQFYLAANGEIVNDWNVVNLESLGTVDRLEFNLSSSDTGEWGMNTPAYFCIDNFNEPYTPDAIGEIKTTQKTSIVYDLQGRRCSNKSGFQIRDGKVVSVSVR